MNHTNTPDTPVGLNYTLIDAFSDTLLAVKNNILCTAVATSLAFMSVFALAYLATIIDIKPVYISGGVTMASFSAFLATLLLLSIALSAISFAVASGVRREK